MRKAVDVDEVRHHAMDDFARCAVESRYRVESFRFGPLGDGEAASGAAGDGTRLGQIGRENDRCGEQCCRNN